MIAKLKTWWHRRWCFDCRDYARALKYALMSAPKGYEDKWIKSYMQVWADQADCKRRMS